MKTRVGFEEDLPRERLVNYGAKQLKNAELISILLASGNQEESVMALSERVLSHFQNDVRQLAAIEIEDLKQFKGIGNAKACSVLAGLELGLRCSRTSVVENTRITSAIDVFELMRYHFFGLKHEEFWVLFLDRSNRIISKKNISKGGVSGTVVDKRIVLKMALSCLASGIILCHNHPSGNLKASREDEKITKQLIKAASYIDVTILDHLIFADEDYLSFKDNNLING